MRERNQINIFGVNQDGREEQKLSFEIENKGQNKSQAKEEANQVKQKQTK
jgi:hypothetical protein